MPQVELRGISKRYPGSERPALDRVDLDVAAGERFAIVGPSGSGKSTLLRIVAGLEKPEWGDVAIGGRVLNGVAPRDRGVGFVFQNPALYPHLSVESNLEFGLRARRAPEAERRARVLEVADWLGIVGLLKRMPAGLSGGERQRVAIGRALATRPGVLLLDEPFNGLDGPLRTSIRAKLIEVHRKAGGTLILVTHDQDEALAVGERVAILRDGRIDGIGRPRELYERPPSRFAAGFLGDPPMSFVSCILDGEGGCWVEGGQGLAVARGPRLDDVRMADLGLRAEAVHPEPRPGDSEVVAAFDRLEPRGADALAWFRLGDSSLAARVDRGYAAEAGAPVTIGLDLGLARWFDRADGSPIG